MDRASTGPIARAVSRAVQRAHRRQRSAHAPERHAGSRRRRGRGLSPADGPGVVLPHLHRWNARGLRRRPGHDGKLSLRRPDRRRNGREAQRRSRRGRERARHVLSSAPTDARSSSPTRPRTSASRSGARRRGVAPVRVNANLAGEGDVQLPTPANPPFLVGPARGSSTRPTRPWTTCSSSERSHRRRADFARSWRRTRSARWWATELRWTGRDGRRAVRRGPGGDGRGALYSTSLRVDAFELSGSRGGRSAACSRRRPEPAPALGRLRPRNRGAFRALDGARLPSRSAALGPAGLPDGSTLVYPTSWAVPSACSEPALQRTRGWELGSTGDRGAVRPVHPEESPDHVRRQPRGLPAVNRGAVERADRGREWRLSPHQHAAAHQRPHRSEPGLSGWPGRFCSRSTTLPAGYELFSVPTDGSSFPERLSAPLGRTRRRCQLRDLPDGARVVYRADQEVDGFEPERADRGQFAARPPRERRRPAPRPGALERPMVAGGDVAPPEESSTSRRSRSTFRERASSPRDQTPTRSRAYSVPIDGGARR
jgi:hypothetical protein